MYSLNNEKWLQQKNSFPVHHTHTNTAIDTNEPMMIEIVSAKRQKISMEKENW